MDAAYQKKAGNVKAEALKIKSERTQEYLEFELKKAYMMLQLAYKMLETLEKAKLTTLANKNVVENYYSNGLVQKDRKSTRLNSSHVAISNAASSLQKKTKNNIRHNRK